MEFGMFHEFPSVPGRGETEMFDEAMAQVDAAERWGLDVMWLAEIHFAPERTYLSSPLGASPARSRRAPERMKIGIAVQVLPLCHPLRLAEEAATVDQVSRGRLIFGVGRSGVVGTYDAYQVPYNESRERFAEIFEIVKLAWSQPRFSYDGRFYRFRDVACAPRPYRGKLPPIRIAASTPDTFPAIGGPGLPGVRQRAACQLERHRAADRELPGGVDGGRPSRPGPGLRLGADLHRRDRGAGPRRSRGERHAFLPAAIRADRGFGAAFRPPGLHRSRRTPSHADLRRRAREQTSSSARRTASRRG